MSDSFETPWTAWLLCPWDFPGKNTGVRCHFLLQGIFLTQVSNLHPRHKQTNSLPQGHREALANTYPLANSIIRRCGSPFFALQTTWLYQSQERKLCGNEVWYLIPQKPTLSAAESSPNFSYIHSFFSILTILSLSFLLSLYY